MKASKPCQEMQGTPEENTPDQNLTLKELIERLVFPPNPYSHPEMLDITDLNFVDFSDNDLTLLISTYKDYTMYHCCFENFENQEIFWEVYEVFESLMPCLKFIF